MKSSCVLLFESVFLLFLSSGSIRGQFGGGDQHHPQFLSGDAYDDDDDGDGKDDGGGGGESDYYPLSPSRYYIDGLTQDIDGEDVFTTTHCGRLRGKRRSGHPGAGYVQAVDWFLGIPYAAPPTGNHRFRPPRPAPSWAGIWNATRFGSACPQAVVHDHYASNELQSEDCLYLNIFSPAENETASSASSMTLFPVMVYIHGGSYRAGSGNVYVGHVLAQYGVVVVTINYRLGILGFLSARDNNLEGNYGLLDQIEALQWIHFNIKAFGGDPSMVTIFGNSAGGSSVGLLSVSPMADGLYSQIIMQSGTPFSFWAVHDRQTNLVPYVRSLAAALNCDRQPMSDLVECLREVDWRTITMVSQDMTDKRMLPRITVSGDDLRPVPDGKVLPDSPVALLEQGRVTARAVMTGAASEEWTRHLGFFLEDLFDAKPHLDRNFRDGIDRPTFEAAIDHVIRERFGYDEALSKLVLHQYTNFGQQEGPIEYRKQYIDFVTDMAMLTPMVQSASLYSKHGIPVYLYLFDHHAAREQSIYQDWQTNYHEIELNYVFGSPLRGLSTDLGKPEYYTPEDEQLSRFVMTLWTNFAKFGNPSGGDSSGTRDGHHHPVWRPFLPSTLGYYCIDSNNRSAMLERLRSEQISFWTNLVPALQDRLESLRSSSLTSPAAAATPASRLQTDILTFATVALTVVLIVTLCLLLRMRRKCQMLSNSHRDSGP